MLPVISALFRPCPLPSDVIQGKQKTNQGNKSQLNKIF